MLNKIKRFLPYIFFTIVSILLSYIYFRNLKPGEFIFSGDQLLRFSYQESFNNSFFLRKIDHFGVFNSWQQIVQLWDSVYYLLAYKLSLPMIEVEKISFFATLLISFIVSYVGFYKINLLFQSKVKELAIIAITLWYCMNPYTLILWHGGIYNLGLAVTYSLTPLIFYYFHKALFSDGKLVDKMLCAVFMFLASFTFWLFAVIVFMLTLYTTFFAIITKAPFVKLCKNLGHLLLIYIPLISIIIFTVLHEYSTNTGDLNFEYVPTFGHQQGGMLYQFLMLFSWGIYTVWTPRTLFPFGDYFLSSQYKIITTSMYLIVLIGGCIFFKEQYNPKLHWLKNSVEFVKNGKNKFLIIFTLLLAISIFFAKGTQPPFGEIFLFFYNHVPFFSVFRSADHRFGFSVIVSVALLLLCIAIKFNKYIFFYVLLFLTLLQSYPMFTGSAIRGENIEGKYYDRIIHVTKEYKDVADFLNQQNNNFGYVLTLPTIEYGHYILDAQKVENHVSQDLLPKFINRPFAYISSSTGIYKPTAVALYTAIQNKDYNGLRSFPIKYLILRNDITCTDCLNLTEQEADNEFVRVFSNELFSIYEIKDFSQVINGQQITFKMINPVKFLAELENVNNQNKINLMLSFNKNWKLYLNKIDEKIECDNNRIIRYKDVMECTNSQQFLEGDELKYLFSKSIFNDNHSTVDTYANSWTIDTDFIRNNYDPSYYSINKDGTLNLSLTIYYQPQTIYYLTWIISLSSLILSVAVIIFIKVKKPFQL